MKRKVQVLLLLFAVVLFNTACRHKNTYDFLHSTDDIVAVSVVDLSFDENRALVETEVKQVADINGFLNQFSSLDCYTYFGDPVAATPEGTEDTVIKILYDNGEYELINWRGQSRYLAERGLKYYAGYRVFDEQQFETFIKYLLSDKVTHSTAYAA